LINFDIQSKLSSKLISCFKYAMHLSSKIFIVILKLLSSIVTA
jgi:hypothetical protein